MTALKLTKTSTALVRVLALPMMVGALAGCDFASRLPDAPNNLGGYDMTQKPPSVTGQQQVKRLPPPPGSDAFAKLKAPVEDRTKAAAEVAAKPKGLEVPKGVMAEAPMAIADAPKIAVSAPTVPAQPISQQTPLDQVAFAPLEFEAIEGSSAQVGSTEFVAPPLDLDGGGYTAPSYDVAEAPVYQPYEAPAYQSYETQAQPVETYVVEGGQGQFEATPYRSAPVQDYSSVPIESYAIAAAPALVADEQPIPVRNGSQISILRSRLPNGAVVSVHPVIGAPGDVSMTLARTVVMSIGAPINATQAANALAKFDLRGRAERNTDGYVAVEWTLLDDNKKVVGVFPERQNSDGWKQMSEAALRSMGQRVGDRIARNGDLRKATLYAAGNPSNGNYATMAPVRETGDTVTSADGKTTFIMRQGAALAQAPLPRVSPRVTSYSAPTQVAARPAPVRVQPVVRAAPRPVIAPAPVQPRPVVVAQAPAPLIAPAPTQPRPQVPQGLAQAPTFPTLRAVDSQPAPAAPVAAPTVVASGPRPLVFRGVRGAPGDGDQALGREVGKLLQQSGARMSATPQPGALFLTAEVSKIAGSSSDRIEIIWRVQDGSGTSIGQVTQANDVPRGALDNAWGQDAFYAAQGARDGIMELLQSSGALDS